jgi:methionine synthase II (cobalamin-independent)
LKIKLKGCHFAINEVIEAQSQAVLITHTEYDFQDMFKNWWKRWERCTHAEGEYFKNDGGQ